ncbi:MAG: PHP domain-containing protein, partial [Abditibacteriota bacterium]|nr:PHP domain-containing protein [Abditibacteriota bacterium]
MASLFKRYHSTEEYYDIERRIRAPWWGRPFSSAVNGILKTAGSPQIRVPAGKLAIDMHVHTLCSYCSFTRPGELLLRAAFLGLGGICIMDHHTVRGYEMALEAAERLKREGLLPEDFILLRGIEYST